VTPLPEIGSLALFSLAADLIPGSAGISGERVTDGVKRLQGKLKSLWFFRTYHVKSTSKMPI